MKVPAVPNDQPRTLLANLVNDVMIESPPPRDYARAMAAVTPRKLWLAGAGDCVVTLAPCSNAFRDYVADITGVAPSDIDLVAPSELAPDHACEVLSRLDATDRATARPMLVPFVIDRPVVELARHGGVQICGYQGVPSTTTLAAIRWMNTKAGFRAVAAELGLAVPQGGFAYSESSLLRRLRLFLNDHEAAIVKRGRSSNGYGTFVVTADERATLAERVHQAVGGQPVGPCGWVYEEFLPFAAAPSLEMLSDDHGVQDFYLCDQRTRDNAWTGMITPASFAPQLTVASTRFAAAAHRIGQWLHQQGYRGFFDVDGGLVGDGYVVTEANVRRTGGTYLEQLARKLFPGTAVYWRADARTGTSSLSFHEALRRIDSAGLGDENADARAMLIVDTLAVDGKWRYLVAGRTAGAVAAVEHEVIDLLRIS